jgi:hypothetical protein
MILCRGCTGQGLQKMVQVRRHESRLEGQKRRTLRKQELREVLKTSCKLNAANVVMRVYPPPSATKGMRQNYSAIIDRALLSPFINLIF